MDFFLSSLVSVLIKAWHHGLSLCHSDSIEISLLEFDIFAVVFVCICQSNKSIDNKLKVKSIIKSLKVCVFFYSSIVDCNFFPLSPSSPGKVPHPTTLHSLVRCVLGTEIIVTPSITLKSSTSFCNPCALHVLYFPIIRPPKDDLSLVAGPTQFSASPSWVLVPLINGDTLFSSRSEPYE